MSDKFESIKGILENDITKDVYENGLKPTVKNAGGIIDSLTGFFNHVILYPIKKLNLNFEYKAREFKRDLEEKYNKIPEQNRQEAPISILGPSLEKLKYRLDDDRIRIMFENLIANSMNSDFTNQCHPRFVEIINLLSEIDALVFKEIANYKSSIFSFQPVLFFGKTGNSNDLPKILININFDNISIFDISSSISNLLNLGLLSKEPGYEWDEVKSEELLEKLSMEHKSLNKYVQQYTEYLRKFVSGIWIEPKLSAVRLSEIVISDFGRNFSKICMD